MQIWHLNAASVSYLVFMLSEEQSYLSEIDNRVATFFKNILQHDKHVHL